MSEPIESPEDWVEITDANHKLRRDIDEFTNDTRPDEWWSVQYLAGNTIGYERYVSSFRARCLRKNLPERMRGEK